VRILQKCYVFLAVALFKCQLCKGLSRLKLQRWVASVRYRCRPNCEQWAMYSYSTTNKMHLLSQIIYSCKTLYVFLPFRPSSGAQNCIYSNGICQSAVTTCCYRGWDGTQFHPIPDSSNCLTYTVAVYAVLSSWWWTEKPSETCRAFCKNK
jgi:hypothetical protein